MGLTNKKLKKSLVSSAEENTQVTRGTRNSQTVLKKGNPLEHSRKHLDGQCPVVGASIGTTLNMDNYESLRVDVWLTDDVKSNETVEQAYGRVVQTISKVLQDAISSYTT